MQYSLEFSRRLIDAAQSFIEKNSKDDEAARAVLYLSLLSCEISLKALLERAGYTQKELRMRSHDLTGLAEDLCFCDLAGTGIPEMPLSAAELLAQVVDPKYRDATVGTLLESEECSKYPSEIRYGDLVRHFHPRVMIECASTVNQWAKNNLDRIVRSPRAGTRTRKPIPQPRKPRRPGQ